MEKLKLLTGIFAVIALLYTATLRLGSNFVGQSGVCDYGLFRAIQPWDSACFYGAIFKKDNTVGDLHYEKYRLDMFDAKGGLSPYIKWYKSNFYRLYQHIFEFSNEEIDAAHWDYIRAQPQKLEGQIKYVEYLYKDRSKTSAQKALNQYCDSYAKGNNRKEALVSLAWHVKENALDLDIRHCYSKSPQLITELTETPIAH